MDHPERQGLPSLLKMAPATIEPGPSPRTTQCAIQPPSSCPSRVEIWCWEAPEGFYLEILVGFVARGQPPMVTTAETEQERSTLLISVAQIENLGSFYSGRMVRPSHQTSVVVQHLEVSFEALPGPKLALVTGERSMC